MSNCTVDQNQNLSVFNCHDKGVIETYSKSELFLNSRINYRNGVSVARNQMQTSPNVTLKSHEITNCNCPNAINGIHRLSICTKGLSFAEVVKNNPPSSRHVATSTSVLGNQTDCHCPKRVIGIHKLENECWKLHKLHKKSIISGYNSAKFTNHVKPNICPQRKLGMHRLSNVNYSLSSNANSNKITDFKASTDSISQISQINTHNRFQPLDSFTESDSIVDIPLSCSDDTPPGGSHNHNTHITSNRCTTEVSTLQSDNCQ